MCTNPYNNFRDKRIMKRSVNQVELAESHFELGQQIMALSRKIERFMKAKSQAIITSLHILLMIDVGMYMLQVIAW